MATLTSAFSRGAQVLLLAARPRLSEEAERRLHARLRGGPDWERVLALARRHRVAALLHRRLSVAPFAAAVPSGVLERLHTRLRKNAVRGLLQERDLVRVLTVLEEAGIRALPFKGAVLGERVYGNVALRPFGDLDIVVPAEAFSHARRLLCEEGFRPLNEMDAQEEATYFRREKSYELVRGDTIVELHWSFLHPMHGVALDFASVWDRAQEMPLGDASARVMTPEDLVLYLCAHGGKHFWERLSWICDVAESLHVYRDALHWPTLLERARTLHVERMLLMGLQLAGDLLGARGPSAAARARPGDAAVDALSAHVHERLFRERTAPQSDLTAEDIRFHLKMRERLRDRLPYYRQLARLAVEPTPRDRDWVELRPSWHFAYYALRPVRLLCEGLDRLLTSASGAPEEHPSMRRK